MKTFLLILTLIITPAIKAQIKEVRSLNIDNCWLENQSLKDKALKWVNFSTGSVGQIEQDLTLAVAEVVDQQYAALLSTGFQSYEGLFHCGSHQSSLVINLDYGHSRVCAWVGLDENGPKLERIGLEPYAHNGYCYGAVFKEAILTLSSSENKNRAMNTIRQKLESVGVELMEERMLSSRVFVLTFSDEIIKNQEKILNELSQELNDLGLATSLDLNYYQGEAGEFHPLD